MFIGDISKGCSTVGVGVLGLLVLSATASGCAVTDAGKGVATDEGHTSSVQGAITVSDASGLPTCSPLRLGQVFFVQATSTVVYCDGRAYTPLNLKGLDGKDGVTYLVTASAATATQCAMGGVLLKVGPDANKDGAIDAVSSSAAVCNGAQGPQGATGPQGQAGADGQNGQDGANGQDGQDGSNGLSSLARQRSEPAGANCANGGTRIDNGVDQNGNGVLEDTEVRHTTFVCAPGASAAIVCSSGFHLCQLGGGPACSDDTSPLTCGSSCAPCTAPTHGSTTCEAGACGFSCDDGYRLTNNGACTATPCTGETWGLFTPSLSRCRLFEAVLAFANLSHVDLSYADLFRANLQRADVSFANLYYATLERTDLTEANFTGADLRYARLSSAFGYDVNFSRANLSRADLTLASLGGANLSGADLTEATPFGANLSDANLSGANLTRANLNGANLRWANLTGANLTDALLGADLTRANLTGANLTGADLTWAITDEYTICPNALPGPCIW